MKINYYRYCVTGILGIREYCIWRELSDYPCMFPITEFSPLIPSPLRVVEDAIEDKVGCKCPLAEKTLSNLLDGDIDEFPWDLRRRCIIDLLTMGVVLQNTKIAHRDIKPDNILYMDGKFYLTDFGLANGGELVSDAVCTVWYRAPEIITEKYDHEVDWWSIGCVIFEILTGYPFVIIAEELSQEEKMAEIEEAMEGLCDRLANHMIDGVNGDSQNYEDIVIGMLCIFPKHRMNPMKALSLLNNINAVGITAHVESIRGRRKHVISKDKSYLPLLIECLGVISVDENRRNELFLPDMGSVTRFPEAAKPLIVSTSLLVESFRTNRYTKEILANCMYLCAKFLYRGWGEEDLSYLISVDKEKYKDWELPFLQSIDFVLHPYIVNIVGRFISLTDFSNIHGTYTQDELWALLDTHAGDT